LTIDRSIASGWVESPTHGFVEEFTKDVGMAVVAGVLLDHMHIKPAKTARLAMTQASVIQAVLASDGSAVLALLLPREQIGLPISVNERQEFAVVNRRVSPDHRRAVLAGEDSREPVALDFGHVSHKAVQRKFRCRNRSGLATLLIESFALQEQGCSMKLEPVLEHGSLREDKGWFDPARISEVFDHRRSPVRVPTILPATNRDS